MNTRLALPLSLVLALAGVAFAAEDAKSVTVKGTLECSKCALKETATCGNVLVVKDGTTETKYYLADNKTSKDEHKAICTTPKDNVSVTGTVEEKDGKKVLTASKIEMPTEPAK